MTTFPPQFVEFDYEAYMCALSLAELCGTSFMHEVKYRYIFYVCSVCVYIHPMYRQIYILYTCISLHSGSVTFLL